MYAGVDEAGRGPVLGPLVVAGVHADPDHVPDGVDDSKALSAAQRSELADQIRASSELRVHVRVIPASELNDRMQAGATLDAIETAAFAETLSALGAKRAIVDAVGADTDAFGARLQDLLDGCQVQARKEADASDPLVGAASILAKTTRDARIEDLEVDAGEPIGSGYPSDPVTRRFLEDWRKQHTDPPAFARTAWATLEKLGYGNRTIDEFTTGGST